MNSNVSPHVEALMPQRNVYLGHVDIGPDAKLDLKRRDGDAADGDVLLYLFRYGLVADQVLMQGSASLKSRQVQLAYIRLLEAFKRNEDHEPTPVYAFALSEVAEGYTEYQLDRFHILRNTGDSNAEKNAYLANQAHEAAKRLDADLSVINVPRRLRSVGSSFRRGLLTWLGMNEPAKTGVSAETAGRAIEKIRESEQIQTFELLRSLRLREQDQVKALYSGVRTRYREANAYGIGAMSSDDSPVWSPAHIAKFLNAIGLQPLLAQEVNLTSELLFKVRRFESFRALRTEYFMAQTDSDLERFTTMLVNLRLNGKVLSSARQSPGALAALVFEGLNEAKIGYKSINKAGELLSKTVLSDMADEHFAKRVYRLHELVEDLEREKCGLTLHSSGLPSASAEFKR
jgi:hypothetical protein